MSGAKQGIGAVVVCLLASAGGALAQSATPPPACTAAEHRQFDFWLGDWDAYTPDGKLVGRSRVSSVLDGCATREEYRAPVDPPPYRGESLSIFDARSGQWQQTWVDTTGLTARLDGGPRPDGTFVLEGPAGAGPPGRRTRMIWTVEGDQLRQRIERSDTNGASWELSFELVYRRAKA